MVGQQFSGRARRMIAITLMTVAVVIVSEGLVTSDAYASDYRCGWTECARIYSTQETLWLNYYAGLAPTSPSAFSRACKEAGGGGICLAAQSVYYGGWYWWRVQLALAARYNTCFRNRYNRWGPNVWKGPGWGCSNHV